MVSKQDGFTLMEVMATVVIISILTGIWFMATGTQLVDARDNKRKTELAMLRAAIAAYEYVKDAYPSTGGAWYSSEPGDTVSNNGGNWIPGLVPNFIAKLPRDPKGGISNMTITGCVGERRAYRYKSSGNDGFKLISHCSAEGKDMAATDELYDPANANINWMICTGGIACGW